MSSSLQLFRNFQVRLAGVCFMGPIDIGLGIAVVVKYFMCPGNLMFRYVGANLQLQSKLRLSQGTVNSS